MTYKSNKIDDAITVLRACGYVVVSRTQILSIGLTAAHDDYLSMRFSEPTALARHHKMARALAEAIIEKVPFTTDDLGETLKLSILIPGFDDV